MSKTTVLGLPLRVYIAAPYTKGDVAVNVTNALRAADELVAMGMVPYIPHLTHFWHLYSAHPYEFWLAYDREWLETCDALLRLPGESEGASREEQYATDLGLPIYEMRHLRAAFAERTHRETLTPFERAYLNSLDE